MSSKPSIIKLLVAIGCAIGFVQTSFSQTQISGPACVQPNTEYQYTISGSWSGQTYMNWCINGGTITSVNGTSTSLSNCASGTPVVYIRVVWHNVPSGSLSLNTSNPSSNASLSVTVTPVLNPGAITYNKSQTISYNTVPKGDSIACSAANSGSCTVSYSYQWQQSTDQVTWTDVPNQFGKNLSFTSALTQTSYYRRKVIVNGSGSVGYSDVAIVFVNPPVYPLSPGNITTPSSLTLPYGSVPSTIKATSAVNGNCNGNYLYQWQYSTDNVNFQDVELENTDSLHFDVTLTQTFYFRRMVTCGNEVVYTGTVTINITLPFDGGAITSDNQVITANTAPALISASAAANCTGSTVVYQWQLSSDGYNFSGIAGTNTQNLSYSTPLSQNTFFRRKATCGAEAKFTNSIIVAIKPEAIVTERPKNDIDTLLTNSGANTDSIFALPADSIANNRRPTTNEWTQLAQSTALDQQLAYLSNGAFDSADLAIVDTISKSDNIVDVLSLNSEGGAGNDSASVFSPYIDDNTIQLYRSVGSYAVLDSLISTETQISFEEVNSRLQATTSSSLQASTSNNLQASTLGIAGISPFRKRKSAVINGPVLVTRNVTMRYTATFNFPLGNSPSLSWVVNGGNIIAQNTNPSSGTIYADVQWQSSFGTPYIAIVDGASNQYGTLHVFFALMPCRVLPLQQNLYYGQAPRELTALLCATSNGATVTYQWQKLDVFSNTAWEAIGGATTANYKPAALTSPWLMYRRVTNTYNSSGTLISVDASSAATVKLVTLDGGELSAAALTVSSNTVPVITQTAPSGGYFEVPGSVKNYYWEVSVNNGPWQNIGSGINFPAYSIQASNTQIRRVVQITASGQLLNNATQYLWKAYSNVLKFDTYYQTTDYENRNYIRENVILTRGITTWENADQLTVENKIQTTTYLDGLSRPLQAVGKGTHYDETTGQWWDLVQSMVYEAGGRVDISPLPYPSTENTGKFKDNAVAAQAAYFASKFGDHNAFAKVEYDGSPLNKVKKSFAPGDSWNGNNVFGSGDAEPYHASDNVRIWTIGFNSADLPVCTGIYPDLFLLKQFSKDEKGKKVITYTDRAGQLVLRKVQLAESAPALTNQHVGWLCTYYVYDDLGQLRYTITPKGVKELEANNWVFTTTISNNLCFSYEYDDEGRAVAKRTAGKGAEYFVYDKRNRIVLTQDANQRSKTPDEWHVSFYDPLNRVIQTALYKTDKTKEQLQAEMNTLPGTGTGSVGDPVETFGTNLVVSSRNTTIRRYVAKQSIEFTTGFESASGDDFTADINSTATGPTIIRTYTTYTNPLPQINLNDASIFTALTYTYYDNYGYTNVKAFSTNVQLAYRNGNVEAYATTQRYLGIVTGSRVRVLDDAATAKWLTTSIYYDEEGRAIQSSEDNINGGVDLTATQYHFDGRALSALEAHTNPGTSYANFPILTKYKFDKVGRLKGVAKKINNTSRNYAASSSVSGSEEDSDADYKTISSYQYNELGRRTKKALSPQFNSGQGLETIEYDYNIRGWLTGINKGYALGEYNSSQWEHYFGMYLGYDNRDGKFSAAQHNGQITGIQWKAQGDNTPRRYNYEYDNANRLTKATFNQRGNGGEGWNNTKVDFGVDNITYDENGNLSSMRQKGIVPGLMAPVVVDNLAYSYKPQSNQLLNVTDAGYSSATVKLGDFRQSSRTDVPQYEYDDNSNTITDRNRTIEGATGTQGITYNHLNLPVLINLPNKGAIRYIYDASGAKLQKIVTDNSPVAAGGQQKVTTTTYIGSYVYETVVQGTTNSGQQLQFIAHEEGRIRVMTPYSNPSDPSNFIGGGIALMDGKQGVFDYYIKDHLSNIRAILTEEINKASSICTMEEANASVKQNEEALFGNPGTGNEVTATRFPRPDDWTSATRAPLNLSENLKVSKLQSLDGNAKIGPNVLLRVMAGDKISAQVDYYYLQNPGSNPGTTGLNAMLQNLVSALMGDKATMAIKGQASGISTNLNNTPDLQSLYNSQPGSGDNTSAPKAYLNYIFFDEQFNYVGESSGFKRVSQTGNGAAPMTATNIKAPRNGYVYVYLSNESVEPVYFDNFAVSHQRSPLIQEDHYYPHGLRITGISSKAHSSILNQKLVSYGYQGSFSEEVADFELNYNEFMLRHYDPQIGRWTTPDPFDEFASPYVGMGNDPIGFVDPTGGYVGGLLAGMSAVGRAAFFTTAGALVGGVVGQAFFDDGLTGMAVGAAIGLGGSFMGGMSTLQMVTTAASSLAVGGATASQMSSVKPPRSAAGSGALANGSNANGYKTNLLISMSIIGSLNDGLKLDAGGGFKISNSRISEVENRKLPTLVNNTESTIWFQPEDGSAPRSLAPGESTIIRIDGLTHPNYPGRIYKVRAGFDVVFGVEANPNGVTIGGKTLLWPVPQDVNESAGGGWKSPPFGGGYFDRLFQKAGYKKP